MEYMYASLYDDIINDNTTDRNDIAPDIIGTVNGHTDLASLSKYYNVD